MKLYHAVAFERGEDGTQLIDLGVFGTKTGANKRIENILKIARKDFPNANISFLSNRHWETDENGQITYEWVADVIPIFLDISISTQSDGIENVV